MPWIRQTIHMTYTEITDKTSAGKKTHNVKRKGRLTGYFIVKPDRGLTDGSAHGGSGYQQYLVQ